ncbi:hypothetical protein MTO96_001525 [Rhipicephalus appendiculatus]
MPRRCYNSTTPLSGLWSPSDTNFYRRNQESNETIAQFLAEYTRLATTCLFGTFLEEALRDRLIAGLRSDSVRCRLLALPDDEVTWDWVRQVATAMEAA